MKENFTNDCYDIAFKKLDEVFKRMYDGFYKDISSKDMDVLTSTYFECINSIYVSYTSKEKLVRHSINIDIKNRKVDRSNCDNMFDTITEARQNLENAVKEHQSIVSICFYTEGLMSALELFCWFYRCIKGVPHITRKLTENEIIDIEVERMHEKIVEINTGFIDCTTASKMDNILDSFKGIINNIYISYVLLNSKGEENE